MKKKKWGLNQRISYGPEGIGSNLAVGLKANESKTEF
jgi:hypothetical protein